MTFVHPQHIYNKINLLGYSFRCNSKGGAISKGVFFKTFNLRGVEMDKKKHSRQQGFTLIEMLIVIIILGLLASLVGPRLFTKVDKARIQTAKAQIELLSTAIDTYRLDMGKFPSSLEELRRSDDPRWEGPHIFPRKSLLIRGITLTSISIQANTALTISFRTGPMASLGEQGMTRILLAGNNKRCF